MLLTMIIIPSDITKRENVEKSFQGTKTKFNQISCWINNVEHELLIKQYFEVNNQVFLTID